MRVVIVGTGDIAPLHVEALRLERHSEAVALVGAMDIDGGRVQTFCEDHNIPVACTDLAELLSRTAPDVVHVCTPPGAHHAAALAALAAGAHVVLEKPPTVSLAEFDELSRAEGAEGPFLATVFPQRFGGGTRRLRDLVRSGELGRPLLAICHTTWFRDQAYFDVAWRGRWSTEGGGPTMGHGIHQIDLLAHILGDWREVSAQAHQQARLTETEDLSLAHVRFDNGAVASIVNSLLSPREESYLRFDFERATVELTHLYSYGEHDWRLTPAPGFEELVDAVWRGPAGGRPSSHTAQFAEVISSVRAGTRPPVPTWDARRTMQLITGIYASAFEHHAITPEEVGPDSPYYKGMRGKGAKWTQTPA